MKFLIAVIALASSHAFACSPALPATSQLSSLTRILDSDAFKDELQAAQNRNFDVRIKEIEPSGRLVVLSNGCSIISKTVFKPAPVNGMCPQVQAVLSETVCQ